MKKSFLLHVDSLSILDEMTTEQAGVFIKSILYYQKNNALPDLDFAIKMAITPFINQFIRDKEKWNNIAERNKHNGYKGGRPITKKTQITQSNPDNPDGYLITQSNPDNPRKPVNVSVSVNDSVNVNVNDSVNGKQKEILFCFDDFTEEEIKSIRNWLDYKKQIKDSYKTQRGIDAMRLGLISMRSNGGNIIQAINNSIASEWRGIYEKKDFKDFSKSKKQLIDNSIAHCNSQDYSDRGDFK